MNMYIDTNCLNHVRKWIWCTHVHRLLQTQDKFFIENFKVSVNLNKGLPV